MLSKTIVHIFKCHWPSLCKEELSSMGGWLILDEKEHLSSYRNTADRNRFCVGRVMLRQLAGEQLGVDGREINISKDKFGKPYFTDYAGNLSFNISHSGDWVVLAFAGGLPVGVDVQEIDVSPKFNFKNVAKYSFHVDEVEYLQEQAEDSKRQKFYEIWSFKEAAIKALGTGFYKDTTGFSILPMPEKGKWNNNLAETVIKELDFGGGYVGAVAAGGNIEDVEVKEFHYNFTTLS